MKINFNTNTPNYINSNIKKTEIRKGDRYSINNSLASYPANYYSTSFKGIPLKQLYEEYNWYIYHDGVPAIKSFLKIKQPKDVMNEFLTEILNAKDRGYEFIDSIVNQPRETKNIKKGLEEKLGSDSQHLLTFIPGTPYNNAYNNYI